MIEWNDPSVKLPEEGELVEIRLPGGTTIKRVEYAVGRFWKVRSGNGGQSYTIESWRAIETRQKKAIDGTG